MMTIPIMFVLKYKMCSTFYEILLQDDEIDMVSHWDIAEIHGEISFLDVLKYFVLLDFFLLGIESSGWNNMPVFAVSTFIIVLLKGWLMQD